MSCRSFLNYLLAAGLVKWQWWFRSLLSVSHLFLQSQTLLIKGIEDLLSFLTQRFVFFKFKHVKALFVLSLVSIVAWRVVLCNLTTTISITSVVIFSRICFYFLTLAYFSQFTDQLGLEGCLVLSSLLSSLEALSAHTVVEFCLSLLFHLRCFELVL